MPVDNEVLLLYAQFYGCFICAAKSIKYAVCQNLFLSRDDGKDFRLVQQVGGKVCNTVYVYQLPDLYVCDAWVLIFKTLSLLKIVLFFTFE